MKFSMYLNRRVFVMNNTNINILLVRLILKWIPYQPLVLGVTGISKQDQTVPGLHCHSFRIFRYLVIKWS